MVEGGGGAAFVRGDERGGERVGYLRAVFAADDCAALDVEEPILY